MELALSLNRQGHYVTMPKLIVPFFSYNSGADDPGRGLHFEFFKIPTFLTRYHAIRQLSACIRAEGNPVAVRRPYHDGRIRIRKSKE